MWNRYTKNKTIIMLERKKWKNKELCKIEALKYNNISNFQKLSSGAYKSAKKYDWLDDICVHMKKRNILNKDICLKIALKYKYKNDFKNNDICAYRFAYNHNFLNDICQHMKHKKYNEYSKNDCQTVALIYNSRKDFQKNLKNIMNMLENKNGWMISVHI